MMKKNYRIVWRESRDYGETSERSRLAVDKPTVLAARIAADQSCRLCNPSRKLH